MRDFESLYFLIRHTFVCATLFRGIKLYPTKQSSTYKSAILVDIQRSKFAESDVYNGTVNAYEYTAVPVVNIVLNLVHTAVPVRTKFRCATPRVIRTSLRQGVPNILI